MKRIKSYSEKKGLQQRNPKMIKESTEFVSAIKELESDFEGLKKVIKGSSITAFEVWLELGVKSGAISEKDATKLIKVVGEGKTDTEERDKAIVQHMVGKMLKRDEKSKKVDDVTFFDVHFGLTHAAKEGMFEKDKVDAVLSDIKGNRVKIDELKPILSKHGAEDPDAIIDFIKNKSESMNKQNESLQEDENGESLCSCNNCGGVFIDTNPQAGAKKYKVGVGQFEELVSIDDMRACPVCRTDEYLSDDVPSSVLEAGDAGYKNSAIAYFNKIKKDDTENTEFWDDVIRQLNASQTKEEIDKIIDSTDPDAANDIKAEIVKSINEADDGGSEGENELSPEAEAALDKELEDALKLVIKELPADLKAVSDGGDIDLVDKLDKEAEAELKESVNEAIGSLLVGGALALPAITKIVGKAASWAGQKLDNQMLKALGTQAEHLGEKLHHKYEDLLDRMLSPFTKHMDPKKRQIVNKVLFYAIIATVGGVGAAGALKAAGAGQAGLAAVETGLSGIKASEIAAAAQQVLPRIISGVIAADV